MNQQYSLIEVQDKFSDINTDKQSFRRHTYLEVYEEMFNGIKDENISILEVGVLHGDSLKLWSKYFTKGEIYGIDIFGRVGMKEVVENLTDYDRIHLDHVDSFEEHQKAIKSREDFFNKIGDLKFDIIIDDGLHTYESQIKTYQNFKHLLGDGGLYIIEDIRDWCSKHDLTSWYGVHLVL